MERVSELSPVYRHIKVTRRGRCLTLALDRPERLNAFNATMHSELTEAVIFGATDPGSDILVITGQGRAFSAGGDVDWQQEACEDPALFERTVRETRQIIFGLIDCEKPTIAMVNGPAVGFGATLALFCDVSIISKSAYLSDPHVSMAMVAGDGGAIIWPQLIGFARAKQYLFTGDRISAIEAQRIGLVNQVTDDADLVAAVDAFADRLMAGAQAAIRYTKITTNIALRQLASAALDAGLGYESLTNVSADHREAISAFREKRTARFGAR